MSKRDLILALGIGMGIFFVLLVSNIVYEALCAVGMWWLGLILFWATPTVVMLGLAWYSNYIYKEDGDGR